MSNPNVFVRAWDWWNNPKARGVEVEEPGAGEPEFERGSTELAEYQKAQGAGRMTDLEATGDMPKASGGQDAPPSGPRGLSQAPARRGQTGGNDPENQVVLKGGGRGKTGSGGAWRSSLMSREEADAYEVQLAEQASKQDPAFFKASAAATAAEGEEEYGLWQAVSTGWGDASEELFKWGVEASGFNDVVEAVKGATKAAFSGDTARVFSPTQDALRTTKRLAAKIKASGATAKQFYENRASVKAQDAHTSMQMEELTNAELDELPGPDMPPTLLDPPDFPADPSVPGPLAKESVRELANINRKALSQVMHADPSFDGLVGTYDMEDPADLKEVLTKLKKVDFPKEVIPEETAQDIMESYGAPARVREPPAPEVPQAPPEFADIDDLPGGAVPEGWGGDADPGPGLELPTFKRSVDDPHTWLERQSVELMESLPDKTQSVSDQMAGSGVNPYELELYERAAGGGLKPELEVLEMRTVQLSGPASNETGPFMLRGEASIKPSPESLVSRVAAL